MVEAISEDERHESQNSMQNSQIQKEEMNRHKIVEQHRERTAL